MHKRALLEKRRDNHSEERSGLPGDAARFAERGLFSPARKGTTVHYYLCSAMCLLFMASIFSAPAVSVKIIHNKPFTEEDLECLTFTDKAMYIGASDEHIYLSRDNGKTWRGKSIKRVDAGIDVILLTSDGSIIAGANTWDVHFIAVSTDHGATWERVWKDDDIMVKTLIELEKGVVIAVGDEDEYVRSTAGSHYGKWNELKRPWKKMGDPFADIDIQDSHTFSNGEILMVGENAFSVCYDRSFTRQLFICPKLNEAIDYTGVGFMNDNEGCVGSDEGMIFRTTDRGKTWTRVYFGKTHISDIAFDSEGHGVGVGHKGLLLLSIDGGKTWKAGDSGTEVEINFVKCLKNGYFIAGGDDGLWMDIHY